jgi:hypothetical protein
MPGFRTDIRDVKQRVTHGFLGASAWVSQVPVSEAQQGTGDAAIATAGKPEVLAKRRAARQIDRARETTRWLPKLSEFLESDFESKI